MFFVVKLIFASILGFFAPQPIDVFVLKSIL